MALCLSDQTADSGIRLRSAMRSYGVAGFNHAREIISTHQAKLSRFPNAPPTQCGVHSLFLRGHKDASNANDLPQAGSNDVTNDTLQTADLEVNMQLRRAA